MSRPVGREAAQRLTFRLDTARVGLDGVMTTVSGSVLLLVAIERFHVGNILKSTIAAASSWGMIAALFYSSLFAASGMRMAVLTAVPAFASGLLLAAGGLSRDGIWFVVFVSLAIMLLSARGPFQLRIYERNYDASRRGRLYSTGMILSLVVSMASGWLFGELLDRDLSWYRVILVASGATVVAGGVLNALMPTSRAVHKRERNPLKNLSIVLTDRTFGLVLMGWFLAGSANFMATPLRVSYLAEAGKGLDLSPMTVLVVATIVPAAVRLLCTPLWGRLFDKVDFIWLRNTMTLILGAGILVYFATRSLPVIVLGSVLLNVGFAGTLVSWNLWVTKVAPRGQSQLYMSVHSFFTGVRGIIAPYLGYLFVDLFDYATVGVLSFAVIVLSIVVQLPLLVRRERL